MSKRFTDTEKWENDWFLELDMKYKLAWLFICDKCDHAGIWKPKIKFMSYALNYKYKTKELLDVFSCKIVHLFDDKWFIPNFVLFQYGELKIKNRAHKSVIESLIKHGVVNCEDFDFNDENTVITSSYLRGLKGACMGHTRGALGDKDKDKDKDKEKEKEKEKKDDENLVFINTNFNFLDAELQKWLMRSGLRALKKLKNEYYPEDLEREINSAYIWNEDQPPSKKKKRIGTFLCNWMERGVRSGGFSKKTNLFGNYLEKIEEELKND